MLEFLENIPKELKSFVVVTLLSLLIGLEQRGLHLADDDEQQKPIFGTDRTFAFIGILGYILYILDPSIVPYLIGGVILGILLAIYYNTKAQNAESYGLTSVMVAFITYSIGPLVITQDLILVLLIFVAVILLAEAKPTFTTLSQKFENEEFISLAKFLILAGIILPIVPDEQIVSFIPTTPYTIWLAVVLVSGISYLGYLLQKLLFPTSGVIITAMLGGLYSSTATSFILARKSQKEAVSSQVYTASITLSTAMMFVKIFVLMFIFNRSLAMKLLLPLSLLFLITVLLGLFWYRKVPKTQEIRDQKLESQTNPLELNIAILFALLFLIFSVGTHFVLETYGTLGLNVMAILVGITDITPFLLNLFEGKFSLDLSIIATATLLAIASNNLMKAVYIYFLSAKAIRWQATISLVIIFLATVATGLFV